MSKPPHTFLCSALTTALLALPAARAAHQTTTLDLPHVDGTLPYTVDIQEVSLAPAALPNIHSVAAGELNGEWVLLAGRTNGLHGLTGLNAFDPLYENREVWVINPETHESWHKSLETSAASGLGQDAVDSLSAVNTQFHQDGDLLVVVGGYGYKRSAADHKTYTTLTAIDLPGLVKWVKEPAGAETTLASDHMKQVQDAYFQVTGGGLEKIGSEYQLVFGQNYDGRYRPLFNGVYTKQVRRFEMTVDGSGNPVVPAASKVATPQVEAYRRRDLNVVPFVERTGLNAYAEKIAILSGVFTTTDGVWTVPVEVASGGAVTMDDPLASTTLKQAFQIYHSAKVSLFERVNSECHFLMFGGITVLERNATTGNFDQDDNAPFTNQCSVVVRNATGHYEQYWLPTRFPLITSGGKELRFGANAEFFPAHGLKKLSHKVLDLTSLTRPTVIGHIFGGIVSDAGNGGNTGASGRVFEVTLTPLSDQPRLLISNAADELTWDTGGPGARYMIEDSTDLVNWAERATGLTSLNYTLGAPTEPRRFFMLHSSIPAAP